MAVQAMSSFDAGDFATDGITASAGTTPTYSTSIVRTGTRAIRCNAASGASSRFTITGDNTARWNFGLYVATMPSVQRLIAGFSSDGSLRLESNGALTVYSSSTLVGTSTTHLVTGQWYWVGWNRGDTTSAAILQIDGATEITATVTYAGFDNFLGMSGTEASSIDIYFDDLIIDAAGFVAPSYVGMLLPTADSAVGTGWTLGTGTAISSNGFDSVNNEAPQGVADLAAGSDPKQIRNASANANTNYDATMATYFSAGVGPNATVLAVQNVVATAAPTGTSAKQGTVGNVSNPAITNIALGSGGTAGAFWSGVIGAGYPTGWKVSFGTLTLTPTVTVGTAPVMRITQVTSSTRIAVVCFMGLLVAWTPGALGKIRQDNSFGNQSISQAVARSGNY